jgi:hypothetical protein
MRDINCEREPQPIIAIQYSFDTEELCHTRRSIGGQRIRLRGLRSQQIEEVSFPQLLSTVDSRSSLEQRVPVWNTAKGRNR